MIIRFSTLFFLLCTVFAAFGVYMVKYQVRALNVQVSAAERELREEKKNLHVLAAEWAFLTRPDRLEQLSGKYLADAPTESRQMAGYEQFFVAMPERVAAAAQQLAKHRASLHQGVEKAYAQSEAQDRMLAQSRALLLVSEAEEGQ